MVTVGTVQPRDLTIMDVQKKHEESTSVPTPTKTTKTTLDPNVGQNLHHCDSHVLLFGDQTPAADLEAYIRTLYQHSSRSFSLQAFLQNTTDALQCSFMDLNPSERKHFSNSFQSILDLVQDHDHQGNVVLSTVLFCIAQLGALIIEAEENPFILVTSETRRCILGVCTGFLAAAAASVSQSVKQLVDIGPDMVCIALRTGLEAHKRSQRIEPGTGNWAFIIVGFSALELQTIIDNFHQSRSLPKYMSVYISARSSDSMTLSGPPSVLQSFFAYSKIVADASKQELPIAAAFHAPHLQRPDYGKIIGSSTCLDLPLTGRLDMISTSSSAPFEIQHSENLQDVLIRGLDGVFQLPLHWNKSVESIIRSGSIAERTAETEMILTSFGPNALVKSFIKLATMEGAEVRLTKPILTETHVTETTPKFRSGSGDIAVVGMAGRLPGADNLQEFWEILKHGQDLHKETPKDRFDIKAHYDPSGTMPNTTMTPFGCFIDKPGLFDAKLFRMSPRDARQTDPIHRLLLLTLYEALEMAGYSRVEGEPSIPWSMRGERIATFFGQTTDDWREFNAGQNIDNFYIPGGMRAFAPGRLNYFFKWEGPSYSIDTACSSSSAAIELACASLISRKCDTAVAGGGNVISGPGMYAGLSRGGFLSSTGNCKTFSDDADGYCRGDGVGVVVLKRLEDAIVDNDNIQGVIKSVHTNHSAHAVSITHPHAPTQQKLYRKVLQNAGVEPSDVHYVEMHGTGTQAGDAAEMESVSAVFGKDRLRSKPLFVGSVKANVGHSEAAAGITSLIKSMLMFRNGEIPPHPMKGSLNRKFSLNGKNILIASSPTKLGDSKDEPKRILLNNFNATGGNTSLLLEGPPSRLIVDKDPRCCHVVTISASTPLSLRRNKERMLQHIQGNPSISLADLAYTTTARRIHHGFRYAYPVAKISELTEVLTKDIPVSFAKSKSTKTNGSPSIVFMFSGQGSNFAGMGAELYSTCSSFRDDILEFESLCVELGFPPFSALITTPSVDLSSITTVEIQLATVSLELAVARLWQAWGVRPDLLIGHSLGEYVMLQVAGVLSLVDMFYLVGKRAQLLLKKCPANTHSMLAIKAKPQHIRDILQETDFTSCVISCINSPNSSVVSGSVVEIQLFKTHLLKIGVSSTVLDLPYAFHSSQVEPILEEFRKLAERVRFAEPSIPVASSLLGKVVRNGGIFSAEYLTRHAAEKVDFVAAVRACQSSNITDEKTIWIEQGPGSSCVGMIKAITPLGLALPTLKPSEPSWRTISKTIAYVYNKGAMINWLEYHKQYKSALRLLELPTYAFDLKDYWIQYEGTWALTKNRIPASTCNAAPFSTTCLQRVETESFSEKEATVTFVSDLGEINLLQAIRGHLINGTALCPSSVYSEMAFTAAIYVHSKRDPSIAIPSVDVTLMEVFHPLVVVGNGENHQIVVTASKSMDSPLVHITFSSRKGSSESQEHGHCTVSFGDGQKWMDTWSRNSYLISDRRDSLFNLATNHPTHRILGSFVYKLFSTLVNYSTEYRCLTEVFMNGVHYEAAAKLRFDHSPVGTVFTYNPYWIDSIIHLAGFVLNGHVTTAHDEVYISHGWESLKIATTLSVNHEYTSYVRMQSVGTKGVFIGDVSLFDGEQIIAICSSLKFQRMKKTVLETLLGGTLKMQASNASSPSCLLSTELTSRPNYLASNHDMPNPQQKTKLKMPIAPTNNEVSLLVAVKILADEIGVEVKDLSDDTRFDELGVDSLLTISITTKLRMHTIFNIPTSVFATYPTVAQFRVYLQNQTKELQNSRNGYPEESTDSSDTESHADATSMGTSTQSEEYDDDIIDAFVSAIAEEAGLEDMKEEEIFEDLGIDSIMSIAILGSMRNKTGTDFPTSIFRTCPTLGHLRKAFRKPRESMSPPRASHDAGNMKPEFESNSVLLQGNPNSSLPKLFLIADGAGSAASYIDIPEFSQNLPIYALESPFLHCPTEFNCSIEEVSKIYISKLRSIQPHGPYFLGGWSLGGIYAYSIAHQLISKFDEEVKGILIIDSPCPRPIDMPEPTMELMEDTGLFIGIKRAGKPEIPMPLSQKQHLLSCVKALRVYDPIPIPAEKRPRDIFMIWAKNGLFEKLGAVIKEAAGDELGMSGGDSVGLKKDWLTAERISFGPNGWERLLGPGIECHAIEGDHFSIMNLPRINVTGGVMQKAVDRFLVD